MASYEEESDYSCFEDAPAPNDMSVTPISSARGRKIEVPKGRTCRELMEAKIEGKYRKAPPASRTVKAPASQSPVAPAEAEAAKPRKKRGPVVVVHPRAHSVIWKYAANWDVAYGKGCMLQLSETRWVFCLCAQICACLGLISVADFVEAMWLCAPTMIPGAQEGDQVVRYPRAFQIFDSCLRFFVSYSPVPGAAVSRFPQKPAVDYLRSTIERDLHSMVIGATPSHEVIDVDDSRPKKKDGWICVPDSPHFETVQQIQERCTIDPAVHTQAYYE